METVDKQAVLEQHALEQLRRGDLRAAHQTLSTLLLYRPNDAQLRNRIQQVEHLVKQREEAQARIQAEPLRYAHAYIQAGRLVEGLKLLRAALAKDPSNKRLRDLALEVAARLRRQAESPPRPRSALPGEVPPPSPAAAFPPPPLPAQSAGRPAESGVRPRAEDTEHAREDAVRRARRGAEVRARSQTGATHDPARQEAVARARALAEARARGLPSNENVPTAPAHFGDNGEANGASPPAPTLLPPPPPPAAFSSSTAHPSRMTIDLSDDVDDLEQTEVGLPPGSAPPPPPSAPQSVEVELVSVMPPEPETSGLGTETMALESDQTEGLPESLISSGLPAPEGEVQPPPIPIDDPVEAEAYEEAPDPFSPATEALAEGPPPPPPPEPVADVESLDPGVLPSDDGPPPTPIEEVTNDAVAPGPLFEADLTDLTDALPPPGEPIEYPVVVAEAPPPRGAPAAPENGAVEPLSAEAGHAPPLLAEAGHAPPAEPDPFPDALAPPAPSDVPVSQPPPVPFPDVEPVSQEVVDPFADSAFKPDEAPAPISGALVPVPAPVASSPSGAEPQAAQRRVSILKTLLDRIRARMRPSRTDSR